MAWSWYVRLVSFYFFEILEIMEKPQKCLYPCIYEGCTSVFNRPYRLAEHLLVHNNIKAFQCTESNCEKAYSNKSHLDRHIKTAHVCEDNRMIYSCRLCLKKYANRQNLKRHLKIKHNQRVPFSCDICQLQFLKKNQLTAHMYQHTGIKSFRCEDCQKDFVTLREKKKHARQHKIYTCPECSVKFTKWSLYQKHLKSDHTSKGYICDECNRHFKQRSHMVRHVRTHFKIVPMRFLCPYVDCDRVYSRNSNLKQHIDIKHKKISHECQICGAKLCTKTKLAQHVKRHGLPQVEKKPAKTKLTGRKERKDAGSFKIPIAFKLTGLPLDYKPDIINVS